jgi:hypothetical protein
VTARLPPPALHKLSKSCLPLVPITYPDTAVFKKYI